MNILIVEDDTALNNGIALSLNTDNTIQAFCIEDAKSKLDTSIDLVILDINLPDGSGINFCREIRKASNVHIIFLTANDMEIDIVSGLESGADDYITKPFSLAVLRARIKLSRAADKATAISLKKAHFPLILTICFSMRTMCR